MPRLINEKFAENVLNPSFSLHRFSVDSDDYISPEERASRRGLCRRMCIVFKHFMDSFLSCAQRCFGRLVDCAASAQSCFRTTQRRDEDAPADVIPMQNVHMGMRVSPKEARERLPKDITWEKATITITQSIRDGLEQYERTHSEEEHSMTINSANLAAIASEVYGAYVVMSMAFGENVGWSFPSLTNVILSAIKMSSSSSKARRFHLYWG